MNGYGKELILDLGDCTIPCTREDIERFVVELCNIIKMEREDLHFWDYEGDEEAYDAAEDNLKGISAIQFIKTSNITIHTIDVQKKVLLNIFSCKEFDPWEASYFCMKFFQGRILNKIVLERG